MSDSNLRAAKQALEKLSADPAAQRLAEERELGAWNYRRSLELAKREGKADSIITVLESRGLTISAQERERILACRDGEQLDRWLRRAVQVAATAELFG